MSTAVPEQKSQKHGSKAWFTSKSQVSASSFNLVGWIVEIRSGTRGKATSAKTGAEPYFTNRIHQTSGRRPHRTQREQGAAGRVEGGLGIQINEPGYSRLRHRRPVQTLRWAPAQKCQVVVRLLPLDPNFQRRRVRLRATVPFLLQHVARVQIQPRHLCRPTLRMDGR